MNVISRMSNRYRCYQQQDFSHSLGKRRGSGQLSPDAAVMDAPLRGIGLQRFLHSTSSVGISTSDLFSISMTSKKKNRIKTLKH
jgi:hypothetical protein